MLRKVVDFANVTVGTLVGAYLVILTVFRTDGLKAVPQGLASSGTAVICFFIGAFLVAGNIIVLWRESKEGGLRTNLRISTDQGISELRVPALEMLVLRDLRAEPDIVEPFVVLKPRGEGKPMLCSVELKLRRQDDVIKRIDLIKRKIRDDFDRLIPGGLTVEVMVEVMDFVSDASRSGRSVVSEPAEFNGPVYSDGGGSDGV